MAWNLSIDNTSPLFSYSPYSDGSGSGGWAIYYSISGFNRQGGDTPQGDSSHITWYNGSNMGFSFSGSAVYLYGEANCSYSVTLDNTQPLSFPPGSGLLIDFPNLTPTYHTITVTPFPNGSINTGFAFDKAAVTVNSLGENHGKIDAYDNRNSSIVYQGTWSEVIDKSVPSAGAPAPYHQTKVGGSRASLEFYGEAVVVEGALNWGHWLYSVTLDGVRSEYNASSWWLVGSTILYAQTNLDPNQEHSLVVQNEGYDPGLNVMSLSTFTVYGSRGRPRPTSAARYIAGGVAGGAIFLVLLVMLVVFYFKRWRRRRELYPRRGDTSLEEIDELGYANQPPLGYVSEPFAPLPQMVGARVAAPIIQPAQREAKGAPIVTRGPPQPPPGVQVQAPHEHTTTLGSESVFSSSGTDMSSISDQGLRRGARLQLLVSELARYLPQSDQDPPEYSSWR